METNTSQIEPVTISEVLEIASWDRPRTDDELRSFLSQREAVIFGK
jgi:hypothetical protein